MHPSLVLSDPSRARRQQAGSSAFQFPPRIKPHRDGSADAVAGILSGRVVTAKCIRTRITSAGRPDPPIHHKRLLLRPAPFSVLPTGPHCDSQSTYAGSRPHFHPHNIEFSCRPVSSQHELINATDDSGYVLISGGQLQRFVLRRLLDFRNPYAHFPLGKPRRLSSEFSSPM